MAGGECGMSLTLIKPSEEYIDEIRAFKQEFIDYNVEFNGVSGLYKYADLSAWITHCRDMESRDYAESLGYVEGEQFMLMNEGETRILGMIAFRHYLNQSLEKTGGHIGYSIRPSEQRKGYGKAMLSLCLDKCNSLGLEKVLITCDDDNVGSRKTIISNGGIFDGKVYAETRYVERYWVPCGDIRIRKAILGDEAIIATIICETWRAAYTDFLSADELNKRTDLSWRTERFRNILATGGAGPIYLAFLNDNACGAISFGKNRDSDLGEVFSCYALESVWGKGIGHAMMGFALADLHRQGFHDVIVWTFERAERARRFYERHSFITDGTVNEGSHGAQEVRYRRTI
jgi:predicted acetyltransferase